MSDPVQFPPRAGVVYRLLEDRFGAAGRSLSAFRHEGAGAPQLTRITLPKGSLFVLVETEESSFIPQTTQTNWGRQLTGEIVENVAAEVLCNENRCIILLSPNIYELVESP